MGIRLARRFPISPPEISTDEFALWSVTPPSARRRGVCPFGRRGPVQCRFSGPQGGPLGAGIWFRVTNLKF